jgi:hypothetical protein
LFKSKLEVDTAITEGKGLLSMPPLKPGRRNYVATIVQLVSAWNGIAQEDWFPPAPEPRK